eukprot:COSAG06_NODE_5955_length_3186_cov_6.235180_2_plen_336_part_01
MRWLACFAAVACVIMLGGGMLREISHTREQNAALARRLTALEESHRREMAQQATDRARRALQGASAGSADEQGGCFTADEIAMWALESAHSLSESLSEVRTNLTAVDSSSADRVHALREALSEKADTNELDALEGQLESKASVSEVADIRGLLETKAAAAAMSDLSTVVADKADAAAIATQLDTKANASTVAAVVAAVELKADSAAVTVQLDAKADANVVTEQLAEKADAGEVRTNLTALELEVDELRVALVTYLQAARGDANGPGGSVQPVTDEVWTNLTALELEVDELRAALVTHSLAACGDTNGPGGSVQPVTDEDCGVGYVSNPLTTEVRCA